MTVTRNGTECQWRTEAAGYFRDLPPVTFLFWLELALPGELVQLKISHLNKTYRGGVVALEPARGAQPLLPSRILWRSPAFKM